MTISCGIMLSVSISDDECAVAVQWRAPPRRKDKLFVPVGDAGSDVSRGVHLNEGKVNLE